MKKVVVISTSLRPGSNSNALAERFAGGAKEAGNEVEFISLRGKEKFKRYDLGLQPSITFLRGKHFQWGFEGSIGLLNAMRQYPEYKRTGSVHMHYLAVTCGWHF